MLSVTSEVGRLRKVLMHEPGPEIDRMVPSMMEELLFDDILYGDRAREEHARMRRALQVLGIETIDAADLLEEVLGDPAGRSWLLDALLPAGGRLADQLREMPPADLASALAGGVRRPHAPGTALDVDELFAIPPLPNWCFQRDPQVVIGSGVVFASMTSAAREREAVLARAIFRFHPDFAGTPEWHEPHDLEFERSHVAGAGHARLEGGDVILVSPDVVAVGLSERTNRLGIEDLAEALAVSDAGPRFLVVVELPRRRAYMHLDTLFTPIDRDLALIYSPVILQGGAEHASVFEIDLKSEHRTWSPRKDLLSCLARRGSGLEPILCGGDDPIAQQREQWTDGANALAIAPGVIAMYDRNEATLESLARGGFRIVTAKDLLLGREEIDLDGNEKVCVAFASHELSRARGGPHCLTHPLVRDP
ncbi:MAG TPA: arginine deiminase family protein [Candidatus Polarisedimenticolaceae bacterium]|nr:arginine deiminase family protein [Candidatus Polarisedimenticolaceae bacterium]